MFIFVLSLSLTPSQSPLPEGVHISWLCPHPEKDLSAEVPTPLGSWHFLAGAEMISSVYNYQYPISEQKGKYWYLEECVNREGRMESR